jgi:hypothetical protein
MSIHRMCSAAAYRRAGLRLSALSPGCDAARRHHRDCVGTKKKGVPF